MTHAAQSLGQILRSRASRSGGDPLLAWYGEAGARTELSVSSVENWVAKTVNLLEEADVGPGSRVRLEVTRDHPEHWMSLIWPLAVWEAGAVVDLSDATPDLVVTGPDGPRTATGTPGYACSLDAWARPLATLPSGMSDYTSEALAQPDAALPQPLPFDAPAWLTDDAAFTLADLSTASPIVTRVLAHPPDAWQAVSTWAAVVRGGGSLVMVASDDPAAAGRIAASERADILP